MQLASPPCEVVLGISSAIAIPGEAGIPVTHRGVSQRVHIVTAHTADTGDGLPKHLEELARLPGTLVFTSVNGVRVFFEQLKLQK